MKDANFLKAHNARSLWHPMTAPADSLKNPPAIITSAHGTRIRDIDGHEVVDAVGGLWNVNLGYSCQPVKDAIAQTKRRFPSFGLKKVKDYLGRFLGLKVSAGGVATVIRETPDLAAPVPRRKKQKRHALVRPE